MKDKKVFLVSKKVLEFLIEPISLYKKVVISKCCNCIFKNSNNKYSKEYCKNFCSHPSYESTIFLSKYRTGNIKLQRPSNTVKIQFNKNNILQKIRLLKLTKRKVTYATPLQSKLLLTYFYFANNKGIINLISRKYISDFIGCSAKSIDACNKILKKFNLIRYQVNDKNELTIILKDFEHQYIEDGFGYIPIAKNLFKKLLNIKNLHEMRLALKVILLYDANKHFGNKTCFSLEKLKGFLPEYKQKKHNLKIFIQKILKLFKNGINAKLEMFSGILFSIDDAFNGKLVRKKSLQKYANKFRVLIPKQKKYIPKLEEKIKSLAGLALEYNFNDVLKIAVSAPMDLMFKDIKSFASYIRYYIKKSQKIEKCFFAIK